FNGYCIIIGRGGAAVSSDVANGLSLRIEAPKEWRIARLCQRESISRQAAAEKLERIEKERARLRAYYAQQNPREPAFNLVFDNSVFPKASLAALVIKAMEEKKMIEKLAGK
ncbi:MAG: cytidylate kinase-like family protein, partial [Planctomycetes bacterium]|nr:cytidylate kinase-like family protein [Planctomycetota bacterium]